jgi:hypothetical protein
MPKARRTPVRAGGTALKLQNSGNEVWLYDEANREVIRTPRGKKDEGAGGMPPDFDASTASITRRSTARASSGRGRRT